MSSRGEDDPLITKYQDTLRELLSVVIGPDKITALKIYFTVAGTKHVFMGSSMAGISQEHIERLEAMVELSVTDPEGEDVETTMSIHPYPTKQ